MPKRPINPHRLDQYAVAGIKPMIGIGGSLVWRYTVFVPISEAKLGADPVELASDDDLEALQDVLCQHFNGVSLLATITGYGMRDPNDADSIEINQHVPFVIYATPVGASEKYVEELQNELQVALDQGLILVERQEAYLTGSYRLTP